MRGSHLQALPSDPPRRVVLYSHDTQGLGHVRRNIEVARALVTARPRTEVVLVSGAPEAVNLPRPEGSELVVLPSVGKSAEGRYRPARLGLDLAEVLRLRGALVASVVSRFRPDLVVVDKEARGLRGELDEALHVAARTRGAGGRRTKLVLGLRDVLDAPEVARRDWARARTTPTLLSAYDAVWVYGDRSVRDLAHDYRLPGEVAGMLRYTGYLATGRHRPTAAGPAVTDPVAGPYVLCLVGGGQDGPELARAFTDAALPPGHRGVVVTGPYLPPDAARELTARAAARDDLTVLGFVPDTVGLIERAAAVVTMGGYNSVCELLASGRPGLVVPRITPRREQLVRAEALAARSHLDHLEPASATPAALAGWLLGAVGAHPGHHDLDLDGLARLPVLADEVLGDVPADEVPDEESSAERDPFRPASATHGQELTHALG